jgi:hypothetical protein
MPLHLIAPYAVLWAALLRALVISAKLAPPSCARCGRHIERRQMGEAVCGCAKQ